MPPVKLAAQVLLNCGTSSNPGSCHGGSWEYAFDFMHDNGITDETCMPFQVCWKRYGVRNTSGRIVCCMRDGGTSLFPTGCRQLVQPGTGMHRSNVRLLRLGRDLLRC